MGALPERVAYLEGQMVEQSQTLAAVREDIRGARADIRDLGQRLDGDIRDLGQRLDDDIRNLGQRLDDGINNLGQRLDEGISNLGQRLDRQGDRLDHRGDRLDQKIDRLDQSLNDKMSRQFLWLVGIQVTTFLVIISALLARG